MATISGTPTTVANNGSYTAAAGSNRVVLLGVSFLDDTASASVTGITFGGVAAHRIGGISIDTGGSTQRPYVDWWYLNEADTIPSGAQTVTVSYSVVTTTTRVHCFTVQNAHQTDFSVTASDAETSTTSLAASLTSLDLSVTIAAQTAVYNATNTGTVWTWTGATEVSDSTSGAPNQRYSNAYRNCTTGGTESIDASWSSTGNVAVAGALFAVLVKNFSAGSSIAAISAGYHLRGMR